MLGMQVTVRRNEVNKLGSTERFPCQNGHCGCSSAAECWNSCCCLSPQQRIAWAKKNGIEPPKFLVAMAEPIQATATASCCSKKSCCEAESVAKTTESRAQVESEREPQSFEFTIKSRSCRGAETYWILALADIVPDWLSLIDKYDPPCATVCVAIPPYTAFFSPPDDPPPRNQPSTV